MQMRSAVRVTCGLLVVGLPLLAGNVARADEADRQALLAGVRQVAAPGWPGTLTVYGDRAFAVVCGGVGGKLRSPVVAASRLGKGRIVAFGHNGYFGRGSLDEGQTGQLMCNAVRWTAGRDSPRVGVRGADELAAFIGEQGFTVVPLDGAGWAGRLGQVDVLCCEPTQFAGAEAAVRAFVETGGGLISAETGWGWMQITGKSLATDHPGAAVLGPAGLMWTDNGLDRTCDVGFQADESISPLVHAGAALAAVEAYGRKERELSKDDLAQATWTLTHAARSLPPGDTLLLPRLKALEAANATSAVPQPDKPLGLDQPLARLALTLQLQQIQNLSPADTTAHPAAQFFPGAVPAGAPRIARTVQVDTTVPAWHSTGLYAAPGELIEVSLPAAAAGKGLSVRIGCHTDGIWHLDRWQRAPEITRSFALSAATTEAASAFGGPVYIDVPGDCNLGTVELEIRNAVAAPYFVLGKTSPQDWRDRERDNPAPWAEMQCDGVIFSLPSDSLRKLDDPVPVMEFWQSVLDADAALKGTALVRERPERYVNDVQISAGYMHSGYPIMTFLDVVPWEMDRAYLLEHGSWGHFHEMGHNHQSGDWTFDGTGEVTVNLFSLYCFDKVCGKVIGGHPAVTPESRAKMIGDYFSKPRDFNRWKSDPFLALSMYVQLEQAFGWEAYRHVFAQYNTLPDGERPQTDLDKRDQWMVRFSREVGRNLGPFFEAWGVPTSEAARASIADLPYWMPEEIAGK
jgi:hypothetical protein